jgi:predicted choloylglycine hydrolase
MIPPNNPSPPSPGWFSALLLCSKAADYFVASDEQMTQGGRRRALDAFPRRPPFDAAAPVPLTVFGINEATPGARWQALFAATWPAYRNWYLQRDVRPRPSLQLAQDMLALHMPELLPTYLRMVELAAEVTAASADDDDVAARMLTLWDPPRFLPGCSQAVITSPEIAVCRNYDYSPELWERVVYSSRFGDRQVIGNNDCLWGLIDGMNSAGLVVSLSFGGRRGSGPGFAVSLVVRYLLEVAASTEQAREILRRMPVAMAYNLTMVDAHSHLLTAYVAPDRAAEFSMSPIATNHRGEVPDSIEHAQQYASVERRDALVELLSEQPAADELVSAFLRPPLYSTQYWRAFGTVYTALYRPAEGAVELCWPDRRWVRHFDDQDASFDVVLQPS